MAFVHNTGVFSEALWDGLKAIYGINYETWDTRYSQFFNVETSDKAFEKVQQYTGFPKAAVKEQGQEAAFSQMFQGYQTEFTHFTYAIGAVVTKELVEDDRYNIVKRIPKLLSRSMRELEEVVAHGVLNSAFDSNYTFSDGQPLISSAHPLVGGGTASNRPSTYADLTQVSLEQGTTDVMNFTDDQGLQIMVNTPKLVIPTASYHIARKLLETQQVVGSTDNDKNILALMNIKPIHTPYLTDNDCWFLITDQDNGLTFFDRRAATLDRDNDFETDNMKMKTTRRFSVGATDTARCIYGSQGA